MRRKAASICLASILVATIFTVIFAVSVSAVNNDHNLSGIVYMSDGNNPNVATDFCIWVERPSGTWNRFPSGSLWISTERGTSDNRYWYSYVLPYDQQGTTWDTGDSYKVQVQGSAWGEFDGNTTSHGTGSAGDPVPAPYDPANTNNSFNTLNWLAGGGYGNEQQWDVRTVAPVDLIPTNVTVDGSAPIDGIPAAPNVNIPIFFNVTNIGIVSSGPFYISLWNCTIDGVNIGLTPIDEFLYPSLDGGIDSGMLFRYWYSPTAPGNYYVNLTVDSQNDVTEFDETNNRIILNFTIGPELIIKDVFVNGAPPTDPVFVGPNADVYITAIVQNIGPSPTGGAGVTFDVTIYNITWPGMQPVPGTEQDILVGPLGSMEETTVLLWVWKAPATILSDAYVNITVDFYDVVWEANEDNNDFTIHFNVPDTPVTSIESLTPVYWDGIIWYIDTTTELYFTVTGNYPPFYTHYTITDYFTMTVVQPLTNFTATGNFNMAAHGEGTYLVEFYSIDSVPNTEPTKSKFVIVDDSEPTTSIGFSNPRYRETPSDIWNITSSSSITITAFDNPIGTSPQTPYLNASGIGDESGSEISYRILRQSDLAVMRDWTVLVVDSEVDGLYTCVPFTFDSWSDDWYVIEYFSVDNLGHSETVKSTTIYLDNTAPVKALDFATPKYRADDATDIWNITSTTDITLTVSDGLGSGINNTKYRISGPGADTGWVTYTAVINIPSSWNNAIYTMEYNSTDNVMNENTLSESFYLDNDGPDSTITGEPSTIISTDPVVRREINIFTVFNMSADDGEGCGVQYIEYMHVGESVWRQYSPVVSYNTLFASLPEDQRTGDQEITVRAFDNLDNLGPEENLYVYLEEDISPPDPPLLEISKAGNDLLLEWSYDASELPEDISHYILYEGAISDDTVFKDVAVDTSGLTDPLGTSWTHTGAAEDGEDHFYVITAVDTKANEGPTSNMVGKVTLTFTEGYNTFALPLQPFENPIASQIIEDPRFTDDRDTIYKYDTEFQQWAGHAKDMPSSMDDFTLEFGEGYMIYIVESTVQYSFVGSSASAIRYMKGMVGGADGDKVFRDSLDIEYNNNEIQLSWSAHTDASGYNIYKGTSRFGGGSLNDYDLQAANSAPITDTSWSSTMGAAEKELYFLVVPIDVNGMEGSSTYAVGAQEISYTAGYSAISMPLQPKSPTGVGSLANSMFDDDSGTFYYYDKENGEWAGHPKSLPENINNIHVNTGSAYIVYIDAEDAYVVTGV